MLVTFGGVRDGPLPLVPTTVVSDPGDVSLDAPADAVEVSIAPLIQTLMETVMGGMATP